MGQTKHSANVVVANAAIEAGTSITAAVTPTIIEHIAVKMSQFSKEDIEFFF